LNIKKIDKDITNLENNIIKYYKGMNIGFGRDPVTAAIQATFFLYSNLTQKELQNYTGYSAGAISQALKPLVEKKIITRNEPEDITEPYIYSMPSMLEFLAKSFLSLSEVYLKKEHIFEEIREGLKKIPEPLKDDPIFKNIERYINLIFHYIPKYKQLSDLVNEEIEKLENS
jgi:DNA-binding transcriptional regulator GbsR (MarR family)